MNHKEIAAIGLHVYTCLKGKTDTINNFAGCQMVFCPEIKGITYIWNFECFACRTALYTFEFEWGDIHKFWNMY